jgi:hypothetical protein
MAGSANEKLWTRSAGGRHVVDQAVGDLPGARAQSFDSPGREGLADELADPGVLRRIHAHDALGDLHVINRTLAGIVPFEGRLTAEPRVAEHEL